MGSSPEKSMASIGMIALLFFSIIAASANTLLFKLALNSFSSPTTNYGFFVNQFSILLYSVQAIIISAVLIYKHPSTLKDMSMSVQPIYLAMGGLDAACGTLAAIAGANCPGEMQTILNQMVIPFTMVGSSIALGSSFEGYQIWGSILILIGAITASSDYLVNPNDDTSNTSETTSTSSSASIGVVTTAVIVYFISVIPSAMSNIYKEGKMKEFDMNELHTSSMVSFWQLWIGFLFLPLMSLPSLGGLTWGEMASQLSDGFTCFMGTNPNDPNDDCSNSAYILMAYVVLNFLYNILILAITKRGSAVLLVISQALSLPITNIAFTLRPLMGDSAEPLSIMDLVGLVLVCIGFLAYSGFGFAHNFSVAQGAPGQMVLAHFGDDHDELVVSSQTITNPQELADLVVGSILRAQLFPEVHRKRSLSGADTVDPSSSLLEMTRHQADSNATPMTSTTVTSSDLRSKSRECRALSASVSALKLMKEVASVIEVQIDDLRAAGVSEVPINMPYQATNNTRTTAGDDSNTTNKLERDVTIAADHDSAAGRPLLAENEEKIIRRFNTVASPSPSPYGGEKRRSERAAAMAALLHKPTASNNINSYGSMV